MNVRRALLTEATRLITDERNNQYGPPTQDFDRTAIMWTAYLDGRRILEAHDVAAMMIILKLSRISWDRQTVTHGLTLPAIQPADMNA